MNIPYAAVFQFINDNPDRSLGKIPEVVRDGVQIDIAYRDGRQIMGIALDEDFFWPDDGETVEFRDAGDRIVFAQRRGDLLVLLMEVDLPADRTDSAEFYMQTCELDGEDRIRLTALDMTDFYEFMQYDPTLKLTALADAIQAMQEERPIPPQGDTMSNITDKIEKAGDRVEDAVANATGAAVDAAGHIENAADSVKGKLEGVGERIGDLRDAAADAVDNVRARAADAAGAAASATRESVEEVRVFVAHSEGFRRFRRDASFFLGGAAIGYLLKKLVGA